jgi:translation elongation factor aEF-1 beta
MGEVAITLKVMPDDMENFAPLKATILETLQTKTNGVVKRAKIMEQDIAFGMKAVVVMFVMDDSGGVDSVEQKISALPHVSSCDTESVDRL